MGRHTSYQRERQKALRGQIHPVMRGIGCLLFVIVPIISYGIAVLLVNYGIRSGWPIPPDWLGTPEIHPMLWRLGGLQVALNYLQAQPNLIANLIFALAMTVLIFGILAIIYGFIFKLFGPPEYGPTDVPPVRIKVKRYKR